MDVTFSKKLPRLSNGFEDLVWRVISSAHNLTVVQTVRRKPHKTFNNICTVLILSKIELGTPKSLNIQSVTSTFPLYQRGSIHNRSKFCILLIHDVILSRIKMLFSVFRLFLIKFRTYVSNKINEIVYHFFKNIKQIFNLICM